MQTVQSESFGSHLSCHCALVVEGFALHGETAHELKMVVALDVLGPCEGILIQPCHLVVPIYGSVDSLS